MNYSEKCPFCDGTRYINNKMANLPTTEAILFENEDLYVRVDISPLCLGHCLIITRKHYLNFFEIPIELKQQVKKIMEKIRSIYKELYHSDVLFFEHGSAEPGYAGASIDHAHLHCIPCDYDISDILKDKLGIPVKCNIITSKEKFKNEYSYIYTENQSMGGYLYKVEKLPSQFLRKIVFDLEGSKNYKWQEKCLTNDSKKNALQTIEDLKGKIFI